MKWWNNGCHVTETNMLQQWDSSNNRRRLDRNNSWDNVGKYEVTIAILNGAINGANKFEILRLWYCHKGPVN